MRRIAIAFEARQIEIGEDEDPMSVVRQLGALASLISERLERQSLSEPVAAMLRTAKVTELKADRRESDQPGNLQPKRAALAVVEAWNRNHGFGTPVEVTRDSGRTQETTTRSHAFLSPGGDPCVMLQGIAGWYLLDRVKPLDGK